MGWESLGIRGRVTRKPSPEHAFAPDPTVDAFVVGGQLIGSVGDSGNAEGTIPHTYFELEHGDTKIDPYPYLEAAWLLQNRLRALR
jgi:murein DD-endopeptidase MepM/ murein hydrolase activator NlpD